jgi:septum site-determining protein MinD
MTKFIAVASGKGGVGKTTTAVNLGTALAGFGRNVIVFDGNISTPNLGLHLGSANIPSTVHDAIFGRKGIRDAVYMHPSGLKLAPGSISLDDCKKADPKKLSNALGPLKGASDIVIIDSAAGISEDAASALKAADEVIAVTTPDLPAVTDTLKTVKLAESLGTAVIGVVLGMARGDSPEMDARSIEAMLELPVIGTIPHDHSIRESLKIQHPAVYSHPDAPASIAYKKLAAFIIGEEYRIIPPKQGFMKSIFRFLGLK